VLTEDETYLPPGVSDEEYARLYHGRQAVTEPQEPPPFAPGTRPDGLYEYEAGKYF
jgi:hypothetical protein